MTAAAMAAVLVGACGDDTTSFEDDGAAAGGGGAGDGSGGDADGGSSADGGATSNGGAGIGGGTGDCTPACGIGLQCCNGTCINPANDINNCGGCGGSCDSDQPFCDNGTCDTPPCDGGTTCIGTTFCCGSNCCELGQLCCVVQAGPVGPPSCYDPVDGTCPIGSPGSVCAHPDTPIATPRGDRRIADLRVGDLVYSVVDGAIVSVPIARASRTPVTDHHVMRIRLDTGVVLSISPLHPTADGGLVGNLAAGDELLGPTVVAAELVPYDARFTHDILPASPSGTYFAGGAWMGSTLAP